MIVQTSLFWRHWIFNLNERINSSSNHDEWYSFYDFHNSHDILWHWSIFLLRWNRCLNAQFFWGRDIRKTDFIGEHYKVCRNFESAYLLVSILHLTYALAVQIRFVYKIGKWNLNIKISKNNGPHMICVHLVKFNHISAIKSYSYSSEYNRTECPTSQTIYFCPALNNPNL